MNYSLQYSDLVLVCIAASLAIGALVGYATSIAFEQSITAIGVVGLLFVGYVIFVDGPVDDADDITDEVPLEEVPRTLSLSPPEFESGRGSGSGSD